MFRTVKQQRAAKPLGGKTTRMVGQVPVVSVMVTPGRKQPPAVRQPAQAVSKAQLKAKMRVTKASKARAKAGTARAKPEYVKLRVGYGKQFDPADIAKRKKQFARQQGENKGKVRSLVARGTQRGRQERMRGVEFKRGVKVATTRLSILKGWGEMEVIAERSVTSSWVRMIHLVKFHGQPALAITFHSGFVALYPTTNIRDYEAMAAAASKGRYIWTALYHGRPGQGAPYISIGF